MESVGEQCADNGVVGHVDCVCLWEFDNPVGLMIWCAALISALGNSLLELLTNLSTKHL